MDQSDPKGGWRRKKVGGGNGKLVPTHGHGLRIGLGQKRARSAGVIGVKRHTDVRGGRHRRDVGVERYDLRGGTHDGLDPKEVATPEVAGSGNGGEPKGSGRRTRRRLGDRGCQSRRAGGGKGTGCREDRRGGRTRHAIVRVEISAFLERSDWAGRRGVYAEGRQVSVGGIRVHGGVIRGELQGRAGSVDARADPIGAGRKLGGSGNREIVPARDGGLGTGTLNGGSGGRTTGAIEAP